MFFSFITYGIKLLSPIVFLQKWGGEAAWTFLLPRSPGHASAIAQGNWVIIDATEGMSWQERSYSSMCDGCYLIILLFWETSCKLALYVSPLLSLYPSLSPPHFLFALPPMKFMISSSYCCIYIHIMCVCLCKHMYI